jgi:long-chain acyl-CoA synthetase
MGFLMPTNHQEDPFGLFVINKPQGLTSHDVVAKVRRHLGLKKVGHMGTLDPMATGVLPIAVGQATRLIQFFGTTKRYTATITFGQASTTLDVDGQPLPTDYIQWPTKPNHLTKNTIQAVLAEFTGNLEQQVPVHSAVKVGGKKLYHYAHKSDKSGQAIPQIVLDSLPIKSITINQIQLLQGPKLSNSTLACNQANNNRDHWQDIVIDVSCSSGTYIRSLVRDIGQALGCPAHLSALQRTEHGRFTLAHSVPLDDFLASAVPWSARQAPDDFIPLPKLNLVHNAQAQQLYQGLPIVLETLEAAPSLKLKGNMMVMVSHSNQMFGIAQAHDGKLRPIKILANRFSPDLTAITSPVDCPNAFTLLFTQCLTKAQDTAMVFNSHHYSYNWLIKAIESIKDLAEHSWGLKSGTVVAINGDINPPSIACFLALLQLGCIVAPLSPRPQAQIEAFADIGQFEGLISVNHDALANPIEASPPWDKQLHYQPTGQHATHNYYTMLRQENAPGLVLFSSGSSGKPKAAVHNALPLLAKFVKHRPAKRILCFLMFDHIGGINTILHTLFSGGTLVTIPERTSVAVCRAISDYGVQILPVSPSFITLLLLSGDLTNPAYQLSSLERITYGTEPMPESTLHGLNRHFPKVVCQQTYGLSELGILQTKSLANDSLWLKMGGDGYHTRVVDGKLEIKAKAAMLGYLNAPSPFTPDGWFMTGDAVLEENRTDGQYFKILGRISDQLNVGGEKVYPAEIESVLLTMPNVADVAVYGEVNAILGTMVVAKVYLQDASVEKLPEFRTRMRQFCHNKLEAFKIPQKVLLVNSSLTSERLKKQRSPTVSLMQ